MEWKYSNLLFLLISAVLMITADPSDDDAPGFDDLFVTNNKTYEKYPIYFVNPLPLWLKGTLIRNGPGQLEVGHRKYTNFFDGYAKLHSWSFPGNGSAFFSSKMLQSKSYITSTTAEDIEPFLSFKGVEPPYDVVKKFESIIHGMDNTNVNVFDYLDKTVSVSDVWGSYEIDPRNLNTIRHFTPPLPQLPNFGRVGGMSTAHPVPEFNKSSRFEVLYTLSVLPGIKPWLSVVRMISLHKTQLIAEWETKKAHYMHSFSVTPNHVILLAAPLTYSLEKILEFGSVESGMVWDGNSNTTVYVVEIKTGKVHTLQTENVYVTHHINAFELPDGRIVMDVPAQKNPFAFNYFDFTYLHNKTARMKILTSPVLTRYTLNIKSKDIKKTVFENGPKAPCAGALELPVFNEKYRHVRYCYIYGFVVNWNGKGFSHFAVVKKDVCNRNGDLMWALRHHYPMELWFVPSPNATEEDDGILMTSIYDGDKKQSYLGLFDPKTMNIINKAYLPTRVPFNFHGRFFEGVF